MTDTRWLCLLAIAGCTSDPAPDDRTPAQKHFWTAINSADYAHVGDVIDQLGAEATASPTDARASEFLGVANIWAAAEAYRDPAMADAVQSLRDPAAGQALTNALMNDPNNYFAAGFIGVSLVDEGLATHDDATLAQGWGLIGQAQAIEPRFGSFVKLTASHRLPASDPRVAESIDAMWTFFDSCIGATLDRTNPDYSPYLDRANQPDQPRFCWDSDEAPHGLEGVMLTMGDALVKSNQIDVARVFYANAKRIPEFANWPHAAAIADRESSDLTARAGMYTAADPTRWPAFGDGVYGCTTCHAKTGL